MSIASGFANLRVRTKIIAGFSSVLIVLAVTGGMELQALDSIGDKNAYVAQRTAVTEIAAAIAATEEIVRNVQQAASGTQDVTTNIAGVSEGASSTGVAATQVLSAAGELSRQSEQLNQEVGRFISDMKAA